MTKTRRLLAGLLSLVLLGASIMPAFAQQQSGGGSGLSITPIRSQFTLSPNQSKKLTVTLKNVTLDKIDAQPQVYDFVADGTTGNPQLLTKPGASSPNSIKKFVYDLQDVVLDRGEQKNTIVKIQIPDGTAPGAYYGVIRYKAVPAGANAPAPTQVALTAAVGTIIEITVPGNLKIQAGLTAIHIYRGATDGSFFVRPPQKLGIEIRNFGNGFIQPFGTVTINNTFGKQVDSYQFNNPKQLDNVLPNSSRIFMNPNPLKGLNQIGRYTASVSMSYGKNGQVLTLKKTFWYIPIWLIIAVAAVLLLLIYLVFRTYRRYRYETKHSYRRGK